MADHHIGLQRAERIQNAETIVNIGGDARSVDHRALAVTALGFRDYAGAARYLRLALEDEPDDATTYYYMVIASLGGRHPDRYPARRTDALVHRLVMAVEVEPACHHAKVLALVINEGVLARVQRQPQRLAPQSRELVFLTDPVHGQEILTHVVVPESPVWKCLERRLTSASNGGVKR